MISKATGGFVQPNYEAPNLLNPGNVFNVGDKTSKSITSPTNVFNVGDKTSESIPSNKQLDLITSNKQLDLNKKD